MSPTRTRTPRRQLVPIAIFANEVYAHPRTVRRWIARGNLPAFRRPGGDLLVDLADVDLVLRRVRPGEVSQ